jgi:hypothetical protein
MEQHDDRYTCRQLLCDMTVLAVCSPISTQPVSCHSMQPAGAAGADSPINITEAATNVNGAWGRRRAQGTQQAADCATRRVGASWALLAGATRTKAKPGKTLITIRCKGSCNSRYCCGSRGAGLACAARTVHHCAKSSLQ